MTDLAVPLAFDDGRVLTFDRIPLDEQIGATCLMVDKAMLDTWQSLYGKRPEDAPLPLAFAPMLLMRAFLTIVTPRPPGNLHVGQSYRVTGMPCPYRAIFATVHCSAKELHKSRRVVTFIIKLAETDEAAPLVSGTSTMFWAA